LPRRLASKADQRPLLVFLVLGETARHASFQLGAYARPTNPRLSAMEDLFYFRDVVSCGTSTAVSIPCMFSSLGQQGFSVAKAEKQPNLLDELVADGIHVTWRTNNSGGADVHARIPVIDFTRQRQPQWCDEQSCHDGILLQGLEQQLRGLSGDSLIVFHQMGSHGPAYDRRYPKRMRTFQPTCAGNDPLLCSAEALRNSYDNSIVYTDTVLAEQIGLLKQASDRFDTALIYVSDHGESLGEHGIYLHGAPRGIAPDEQKHIPFFIWMSPAYMQRMRIDAACLRRDLGKRFSHDNLYHTVLGAMALRNDAYREDMDMLEACRKDGG
jgi:lipid A ethanolaminephosphotransferase